MAAESDIPPTWPRWKRLVFRFGSSYLALYCLSYLGYHSARGLIRPLLDLSWTPLMRALVPWLGEHLLGVSITVFPNGSLDTTYNWGEVLLLLCLAGMTTATWSWRSRQLAHPRLWDRLQILLRYFLAGVMLRYGTIKLFGSQFRDLDSEQLLTPLGELSPMALLWSLIGTSPAYELFGGLAETAGALLLFSRRTTPLGALLLVGTLSQVVLLNLCFDVPVKGFSTHLLLMSAVLLLPDARRLAAVLFLHQPTQPRPLTLPFGWARLERIRPLLKAVVILVTIGMPLEQRISRLNRSTTAGPLAGSYTVTLLSVDGVERPPLLSDSKRWQRIRLTERGVGSLRFMDGSQTRWRMELSGETLQWTSLEGEASGQLHVSHVGEETRLTGELDGHTVTAHLQRVDPDDFPLLQRGFHLINEYPYSGGG